MNTAEVTGTSNLVDPGSVKRKIRVEKLHANLSDQMKKHKTILQLLFPVALYLCVSCGGDTSSSTLTTCTEYLTPDPAAGILCTSDTCNTYLAIWKNLFLERNHLTEEFFDNHITLRGSGVDSSDEGFSFNVCYEVRVEWAVAYTCDQFIFNIKGGLYPDLPLPRNVNLTKENIAIALDNEAFGSEISVVANDEILKLHSQTEALEKLKAAVNVSKLCYNRISLNSSTGKITLDASAQYVNRNNSCIFARMVLADAEASHEDTPCWIF